MIPKIIHYCWFGGNPLPDDAKKYIESWKKYCPGYEIREWNEETFDLTSCDFVREAYENKKWAFITDYVRLAVLYQYGGIYMDTDVEVIKPLDEFLTLKGFSGFESETQVPTGIMASERENIFIKKLLDYYEGRHFILPDGSLDTKTNVIIITDYALKEGLIQNNTLQNINDYTFYPKEYFCPKDYTTGNISITENTYCIHHFSGSWLSSWEKEKMEKKKYFIQKYGEKNAEIIFRIWKYVLHPSKIIDRIKNGDA